jgi:hypothetical protein
MIIREAYHPNTGMNDIGRSGELCQVTRNKVQYECDTIMRSTLQIGKGDRIELKALVFFALLLSMSVSH